MKYRRFGRTGIQMPVFSCGGMRYQQSWSDIPWDQVPAAGQANLEATIARSMELGIHHIETARGYGSSEMQLGPVLAKYPRESMILQTKVMPKPTAREFLETFETSMAYLKQDYVDLLSIHGINNRQHLDETLRKGGCLEVCRQLQREGRVRHVGFSTHATPDVISEVIRSDEFDYVNLHWYFVNDLNRTCVAEAAQRDMGVFIISPNDKGGKLYLELPKMRSLCAPLTPMQFNDLYCLIHPEIHTLSIGAAKPSDFDEHLKTLPFLAQPATSELLHGIARRLEVEFLKETGVPMPSRWDRDLPAFQSVPGVINLQEICRLVALDRAFDMQTYGKLRYNLLGNGGHWFPGVNAAEFDEVAIREIGTGAGIPHLITILREAHDRFGDEPRKRLQQD